MPSAKLKKSFSDTVQLGKRSAEKFNSFILLGMRSQTLLRPEQIAWKISQNNTSSWLRALSLKTNTDQTDSEEHTYIIDLFRPKLEVLLPVRAWLVILWLMGSHKQLQYIVFRPDINKCFFNYFFLSISSSIICYNLFSGFFSLVVCSS